MSKDEGDAPSDAAMTALRAPLPERPASPLARLSEALADRLRAVDGLLSDHLNSSTRLIPQVAAHLIAAGGKRVRPVLTLAAARLCGYEGGEHDIRLAASVEFIHTATLLHDDVVDGSAQRRGRPAANLLFGNKPSILVGDFLFSRAFQLMVETGSLDVLRILSDASAVISEGEVMQLSTANNLATTPDEHLAVIRAKTAALFAAAAEVGGVIAGASPAQCAALATYGDRLGIAFQLADDALDYAGSAGRTGKDAGDDFREGKVTAPVLHAFAAARDEEADFWRRTIEKRDQRDGDLERAVALMAKHRAVEAALDDARRYAAEARAALEEAFAPGEIRDDLAALVTYVVERDR